MNRQLGLPGNGKRVDKPDAGWLPRGYIDGLALSNDTTDATNDISFAPGVGRSTFNIVDGSLSTMTRDQRDIEIPVAIIKQLDTAFAPENYDPEGYSGGGRSGGRCTSALSDTWWHAYGMVAPGQPADVLFVDSAVTATVAAELYKLGYTAGRMIGSVQRASSALVQFIQDQDYFMLVTPVMDVNATTPGTGSSTRALASVPLGIRVRANVSVYFNSSDGMYISALAQTDQALSATTSPLYTTFDGANANGAGPFGILTDTAQSIRMIQASNNPARIVTHGYWHPRGKNA